MIGRWDIASRIDRGPDRTIGSGERMPGGVTLIASPWVRGGSTGDSAPPVPRGCGTYVLVGTVFIRSRSRDSPVED